MTTVHDSASIVPPAIAQHFADWVDAFNLGDTATLDQLYAADGVLVPVPGQPVTGAERAAANAYLVGLGGTMSAAPRRCYVAGDLALVVIDWSIEGTAPDGAPLSMAGTATDVLRRDAVGTWRVAIDNPSGTA